MKSVSLYVEDMSIRYIDFDALVEINKQIIERMGGKFAIINEGNLRYCIDSVFEIGDANDLVNSCINKAAFLIWCICVSHGFLDNNKRTAFQAAYVFLLANGFELYGTRGNDMLFILTNISTGGISKEKVREWISKHIKPV